MIELAREVARFFPYAQVRPFQDEFIKTVHDAVEKGSSNVIEGSNGLGKTVAARAESKSSNHPRTSTLLQKSFLKEAKST